MLPLWRDMMAEHARLDAAFALADDAAAVWSRALWELMARHDSFVFVSPEAGFCCGWLTRHPAIYAAKEVGLLSEICVSPSARRQGVGRALMASARAWFTSRDVDDFQLATAIFNEAGQKFFQSLGGRPILMRFHFAKDACSIAEVTPAARGLGE